FLTYADNGLRPKRVDADLQLAKGILDCAELLKSEFDLINDFQLTSLMKTPDVVTVTFDDDAPEILEALLSEAVAEAAEKLDEMRVAEGARLAADMSARIDEIESVLQSVKARAPFVAAEYRKKLAERIREAVGNSVEVDEARLLNEAAFFADKSNIDEEIERLASHIAQARKIMAQGGECGKKLDFLIQEFNRETNTICSKSNDLSLTEYGLKLKNEIEKLREQVQNIE
ncbi:MAG: YicC/YloC family endoribonuclease, partial [Christensenellales bacterium]